MNIVVINLDRDSDRLAFMHAQLTGLGLAYDRLPAVDGARLTEAQTAYHRDAIRRDLSLPEIGCLLSHIEAWKRIAAQADDGCTLVLEDDVHFARGFAGALALVRPSPDDPVVHRLETMLARVTAVRRPALREQGRACVELLTNHAGAAAYVLTRAGARQLLAVESRLSLPPDGELFDFGRRAVTNLRVFQWLPAPCIQDHVLNGPARRGFLSHLEQNRLDIRTGRKKADPQPLAMVKAALRPLHTAVYDAALRPSGRSRKLVPFG